MNNYIALTKVLLKNSLSSFSSGKKQGRLNNKIKNIALGAVIFVSLLPLAFGIGAAVWGSYPLFSSVGLEGLVLGSGLMMVSMLILFFGIFYVMNIFYFSKDVESLLALPLRPSTIMAAKFTVTLLYEYLTELLLLAPVLIAFGVVSKSGFIYYLYSSIAFLTLPIIPLVYSVIINMLLMRVTNLSKNRDQLRIVGGIIAMFVAIFANIKIQSLANSFDNPEQLIAMLSQGNNPLLGIISGIFPANRLMATALVNSSTIMGFANILLYLGISVIFIILFLTLGEALYFKGLIGISESKSKQKKITLVQFEKSVVKSSGIISYTIKELKLLFRTPVYFINCVMMNFLWPVFLLIPFLVDSSESMDIYKLQTLIKSGPSEGIVLGVAFAAILFASGANGVTSTAISREGENIFASKYLPISYHDQIMAKVLSGVALGLIAMLSMLAAVIIMAMPAFYMIVFILFTGVLAVLFTSLAGILIDLNFPKLHWDSEQKAVKQNMNVVVHMLVSAAAAAIIVLPVIFLKFNVWIVLSGIIAVFGFVDTILYGLIKAAGGKLFEKIEA